MLKRMLLVVFCSIASIGEGRCKRLEGVFRNPTNGKAVVEVDAIDCVVIREKRTADLDYLSDFWGRLTRKQLPAKREQRYRLGANLEKKSGLYAVILLNVPLKNLFGRTSLLFEYRQCGSLAITAQRFQLDEKCVSDQRQILIKLSDELEQKKIVAWCATLINDQRQIIGKKSSLLWGKFNSN